MRTVLPGGGTLHASNDLSSRPRIPVAKDSRETTGINDQTLTDHAQRLARSQSVMGLTFAPRHSALLADSSSGQQALGIDRNSRRWLLSGRLGPEGYSRGFYVSLREWIVDALVFGAVGSNLWLFVLFVVPRFGHIYLQAQSAACQGPVRQKQGRVCWPCQPWGKSHPAHAPIPRSRSRSGRLWAVSADATTLDNEIQR